jgi:hypothetical protein
LSISANEEKLKFQPSKKMNFLPREITSHIMSFFNTSQHDLLFQYFFNCLHLETINYMSTEIVKLTIPLKHQQQQKKIENILTKKLEELKNEENKKNKSDFMKMDHFFKGNSSITLNNTISFTLLNDFILNHFDTILGNISLCFDKRRSP